MSVSDAQPGSAEVNRVQRWFQAVVMHPDGALKVKQKLALSKEYVRVNHPGAFDFAKRIKTAIKT